MTPWLAALLALFVWWFSTGIILMAVKHADRRGLQARRGAVLAGLPLLVVGIWGFEVSLGGTTATAACIGFLSALAIWGWIELAFLTGVISGPIQKACPPDIAEWERFLRAWGTVAFHEMLLTGALICVLISGWDQPNSIGVWTFVVLYFARISAKLNLFFGVPKINTEFLPTALAHLPSHFRIRRLNWVFPVSVTALTFAVACWLERLHAAQTEGQAIGFALLTAITALALLEHWLMVLPLPDERLWRWMLPEPTGQAPKIKAITSRHEDAHGL
ncbi:MAG: putative photosynthetic complex assembly protein PuhE [Rhodobacteraceae bacterium]|nr:putative photosynthetic complex assembly protein PuhE [Paracoccaceae bacterium]